MGSLRGGQSFLSQFRKELKITCFCDNDKSKWGKTIGGYPIKAPHEICSIKDPMVIIAVTLRYNKEIVKQLEQLRIPYISQYHYLMYTRYDSLYQVYHDFLTDEKSKEIFVAKLLSGLQFDPEPISQFYENNQYFAVPQVWYNSKVLIDCGAFVGDTVENYLNHMGMVCDSIYAFEPCDRQFNALKKRASRLVEEWALSDDQFVPVKSAVGQTNGTVYLDVADSGVSGARVRNDATQSVHVSEENVQLVSLDSYFSETTLKKDILIKADIEGEELAMLKGASGIIQKYCPNLAICIYHKVTDLCDIPHYIHSLMPGCKMSIRHHSFWDSETVLYCYL